LSASPSVLQWRAIERWDGKLPMMQGGEKMPLLTFDVGKLAGTDADRERRLRQILNEEEAKEKEKAKQNQPNSDNAAEPLAGGDQPTKPAAAAPANEAQQKP